MHMNKSKHPYMKQERFERKAIQEIFYNSTHTYIKAYLALEDFFGMRVQKGLLLLTPTRRRPGYLDSFDDFQ